MKNWQKGYSIDSLQEIVDFYKETNQYALSPFTEINKQRAVNLLDKNTLVLIRKNSNIILAYNISKTKVKTAVKFNNKNIAYKLKDDIYINHIAYSNADSLIELNSIITSYKRCFIRVFLEDKVLNELIENAGFMKITSQFKSTGEILAVYVSSDYVDDIEDISEIYKSNLIKFGTDSQIKTSVVESIKSILSDYDFKNHYSNYNKNKSWSALSVRGYSEDIYFIEKPKEMLTSKKFGAKYQGKEYVLQNTSLFNKIPVIQNILDDIFPNCEFDRIRFMKLDAGNGELKRHTDQSDPDSGLENGKVARFHIPIITNENVEFSSWDWDGNKIIFNPAVGEMFYLDTTKPHTVFNGGDTDRIHLVIDVFVNEYVCNLLLSGNKIK